MRIAVMQPYFFPYAGYFRLFAAVDAFVLYDCIQFPKGGWVHRNRLSNSRGEPAWLTLPIARAPLSTTISDVRFLDTPQTRLAAEVRRFPALMRLDVVQREALMCWNSLKPHASVVDYLHHTLAQTAEVLGVSRPILRSSSLSIDAKYKGVDRVLAICERTNAHHYVNAPGGIALYDPAHFRARGVTLQVLRPWEGPYLSTLEILSTGQTSSTTQEILRQSDNPSA